MAKKRFFPALLLTLVLALSPLSAFAESGAYAVKFYPGDYGTMTKNDQIPFVYYGIDDDVNKPYYYKLNVSETETLSFAGSIIDTLLPNSGYEFAYWTADAAVYRPAVVLPFRPAPLFLLIKYRTALMCGEIM